MHFPRFALTILVMLCAGTVQAGELVLTLNIPHKDTRTVIVFAQMSGEENRQLSSSVTPCVGGIATVLYTHASHPGGNQGGRFNEDNWGRANRCYLNKSKSFYIITGWLENSHSRDTSLLGPGVKLRLFEIGGLSTNIGAEIPFVNYGLRSGKVVRGFLPLAYAGISYRISKSTEVGLMQMWLPKEGVTLRGAVIDGTFPGNFNTDRQTNPHLMPPSSWNGSLTRPSLVLSHRF